MLLLLLYLEHVYLKCCYVISMNVSVLIRNYKFIMCVCVRVCVSVCVRVRVRVRVHGCVRVCVLHVYLLPS